MTTPPPTTLAEALAQERQGQAGEGTRKIRVRHGVYGLRDRPGRYLVRLRLPAGIITAEQVDALAGLAETFGDPPRVHITTRQGLEFYGLTGDQVLALLEQLATHGLTTRNSGGNVLRGVVCCARAGVAPDEPFDVTPYALAVDQYFGQHPDFQHLPRKVKASFEGCPEDHVHTAVSDIGLRAALRDGRPGFHITVGGGLGASPMLGMELESFTPAEEVFSTIAAILRFFDAHGNRQVRARARLKWIVQEWGADRVRAALIEERQRLPVSGPRVEAASAEPTQPGGEGPPPSSFENVRVQKQPGLVSVGVHIPLGDLFPDSLRALAAIAREFSESLRLSIDQNVVLRSVPQSRLAELQARLLAAGLARGRDERLIDITRCAGRSTCVLAITDSRAAAESVAAALEPDLAHHPDLQGQRIRISGCPNACSHHHWADIGLFGVARIIDQRAAPHYAMVLGGGSPEHPLGRRILDIPARRVGTAVRRVLTRFLEERQAVETFGHYVARHAPERWTSELADLAHPGDEALFYDLGSEAPFTVRSSTPKPDTRNP